jgi:D-glycero-D-manno-heptose 1,7-bisphosphate phosphatase
MIKKPKVVIIAGGLATRMSPITDNIPKCLIDVNGAPLIQHQIEFFRERGYKEFVFCVAHLANKVKEYFGDGSQFGVSIEYSLEPNELLGSAGAVKLIENIIDSTFIVFYGDNLTNLNFDKFLKFHKEKNSQFTIFLKKRSEKNHSSSLITMNDENKIISFIEKPSVEEFDKHKHEIQYINNGIYLIEPELIREIPENIKYDFGKDAIPTLLQKDHKIYGYLSDDFYVELGRVEKYETFLARFKCRKNVLERAKAIFLDRDGVINEGIKNLSKPEQFRLIPRVAEAIRKFNDGGYLVIVVTNQPIIAKGFCTGEDIEKIHHKMKKSLAEKGAHVDAIYLCPHHPEKGFEGEIAHIKINCECRKPKPGLILNAVKDYNLDLFKSWMIGDSFSDVQAGKEAGVMTILLTSGDGSGSKQEKELQNVSPNYKFKSLIEAAEFIMLKR